MSFRLYVVAALALACGAPDVSSLEQSLEGIDIEAALAEGLVGTSGHTGWTSVSGSVGDDGQAHASVPILVPPGRSGMEPRLALSYVSGGSDGPMGPGWSLSGLSAITVCPATIELDGVESRRPFEGKPVFCLDGQRLVPTESSCTPIHPCTDPFEMGQFRLANSVDVRVHLEGDLGTRESTFTVYTRDGTVRRYGGSENSLIEGQTMAADEFGEAHLTGEDVVFGWLISSETDRASNSMVFEYARVAHADGAVEVLPAAIRYTDHPDLGEGRRRVEFSYIPRTSTTAFVAGLALRTSRSLAKVETFAPHVSGAVRSYSLSYAESSSTRRPLLREIVECEFSGACRDAVEFDYTERDPFEFSAAEAVPLLLSSRRDESYAILDLDDNEGRQALNVDGQVARRRPSGWVVEPISGGPFTAPRFSVDTDGDGRSELLVPGTGVSVFAVEWRHTGHWSGYDLIPLPPFTLTERCSSGTATTHFGNFDGAEPGAEFRSECGNAPRAVLDLDGDGIDQVVELDDVLLPGAPEPEVVPFLIGAERFAMQRHYGDFNGDGLMDVLGLLDPTRPRLWINTGNGFLPVRDMPIDFSAISGTGGGYVFALSNAWRTRGDEDRDALLPHRQQDFRLVDVNHDGLVDIMAAYVAGRAIAWDTETHEDVETRWGSDFVLVNRGDHFEARNVRDDEDEWFYMASGTRLWTSPTLIAALADFDGDGNADRVNSNGDTGEVVAHMAAPGTSDRLASIRRASVELSQFEYGPLAAVHTPATHCGDGTTCGRTGTVVHTHVDEDDYTYDHEYAGLRYDLRSGNSLGFSRHTQTTRETGNLVERRFDNLTHVEGAGYPYANHASMEMVVRGGTDAPYHVELTDTTHTVITVAADQSRPTYQTAPVSSRTRIYEVDSWEACQEECDVAKYRLNFEDGTTLRAEDRVWEYDANASLRYQNTSIPGSTEVWTTYTLENRAGPFLLGLRRRIAHSSYSDETGYVHQVDDYTFDSRGLMDLHVEGATTGSAGSTTDYDFDEFGQLRGVTQSAADVAAVNTTVDYDDEHVSIRKITDPLGFPLHLVVHPANGEVVLAVDANDRQTKRVVDGFGRTVEVRAPGGWSATEYLAVGSGAEVRQTGSGAAEQRISIDPHGRMSSKRVAGFGRWIQTDYVHDAHGHLDRILAPNPSGGTARGPITKFHYDSLGRVTKVERDGSTPMLVHHDGRRTELDDGSGATRWTERDLGSRIEASGTSSAEGTQHLKFRFGAFGRLMETTDHRGHRWRQEYDERGLLMRQDDPDSGATRYKYDGFARLREELDDRGEPRRIVHRDAIGRPQKVEERDLPGDPLHATEFAWDSEDVGQLTYVTRSIDQNIIYFEYDPATGRVVRETLKVRGEPFHFDYGYDADGLLETLTYPDATGRRLEVTYAHDSNGYLQSARADSVGFLWEADSYSSGGGVIDEHFGNGLSTTRIIDPYLARTNHLTTKRGGTAIQDVDYTWSALGRLDKRSDLVASRDENFVYDQLGRLTDTFVNDRQTGRFEYDSLGNLTELEQSAFSSGGSSIDNWGSVLDYTGPHRLAHVDGATAVHDEQGRWVEGADFLASYNQFDLPTSIKRGGTTTSLEYDAFGSRVRTQAGSKVTINMGRDFERITEGGKHTHVLRIEAAGRVVGEVHLDTNGDEELRYLHPDHLGSTAMVTDNSGEVLERYRYAPFGERLKDSGARFGEGAIAQSGFGSHRQEDGIGFTDMGGRFYDARIGRFMSVDPYNVSPLNRQSYNGYAFVMNDPMSRTDPTGLWTCDAESGSDCSQFDWIEQGIVGILGFAADRIRNRRQGGRAGEGHRGSHSGTNRTRIERPPTQVVDVQESSTSSFTPMRILGYTMGGVLGFFGFDDMPFSSVERKKDKSFVRAFYEGNSDGAVLGMAVDSAAIVMGAASMTTGEGALVLAPITGGASAAVGVPAVVAGAALTAAGGVMGPVHQGVYERAQDNIARMESHGNGGRVDVSSSGVREGTGVGRGREAPSTSGLGTASPRAPTVHPRGPAWDRLETVGGGRRASGHGRSRRYYEWDHTHGDIEVYNRRGEHLGSMDPLSGDMYKPPEPGRTIDL